MKKLFAGSLVLLLLASLVIELQNPRSVAAQNFGCDRTASISVSLGSSAVLVATRPGTTTLVCGFVISGDTITTTAVFKSGTGTTCGTGTVSHTGAMRMPDEGSIVFGTGVAPVLFGEYNTDFCITTATGAVTGVLLYRQ